MRTLVTGSGGYIGSQVAYDLLRKGYEVIGVDNFSRSSKEVTERLLKKYKKFFFYEVDLTNYSLLEASLIKEEFDSILHFAAFKSVPESMASPVMYYGNNLISFINILNLSQKKNVSRIVFSSSCTVYGQPDKLPITEESDFKIATSPYGRSKQICEEIFKKHSEKNNISCISLRYFNPIGASNDLFVGDNYDGKYKNVVPLLLDAHNEKKVFSVFGADYDTPDGTPIRDYIDINDLSDAHLKALSFDNGSSKEYDYFNIGTGKGTSVLKLIQTFEKAIGDKFLYKLENRREGDVEKIFSNALKAKKNLQFEAKISLEDSLKHAWLWDKKRGTL